MRRVRIPPLIALFFIVDGALALMYIANYLIGQPYRPLNVFVDLDGEGNLPAWYSSIQWFSVAILTGLFAYRNASFSNKKSWSLVVLPLLFLMLSLDETTEIHEFLGKMSDQLLPGGRQNTLLPHTGIWMFLVGLPFMLLLCVLIVRVRAYFVRASGALYKIVLGMAVMLAGAIGVETFSNVVARDSIYSVLQIWSEESLEMVGATIVLWGSYEWLARYGFVFTMERAERAKESHRKSVVKFQSSR